MIDKKWIEVSVIGLIEMNAYKNDRYLNEMMKTYKAYKIYTNKNEK